MSATQQVESQPFTEPQSHEQSNARTRSGSGYRIGDPRRKSAFLAGVLSLMPGLGHTYVGYVRLGFINFLIAGTVFSYLLATEGDTPLLPLGIVFLFFFEFFNIIDAVRRASLYNLTLEGIEQINLPDPLGDSLASPQGSYLVGSLLVVLGIVAFSNTLLGLSLDWLENWWPALPLGLGAYLIYKAFEDSQKNKPDA